MIYNDFLLLVDNDGVDVMKVSYDKLWKIMKQNQMKKKEDKMGGFAVSGQRASFIKITHYVH